MPVLPGIGVLAGRHASVACFAVVLVIGGCGGNKSTHSSNTGTRGYEAPPRPSRPGDSSTVRTSTNAVPPSTVPDSRRARRHTGTVSAGAPDTSKH